MTDRESRVRTAILRRALLGRDAAVPALAGGTGLTPAEVRAALAALHDAGAVYLRDGAVAAAYPLSLVPTGHRVTIGAVTVYANCAVDALAVPPMTGAAAEIASACGHCQTPILVTMQGDRLLGSEPAAPVVFHLAKDCCAPGPAVLTRCPHIQFFCGGGHAALWQRAHPEHRGTTFELTDAAAYARRHFVEIIDAVRRDATPAGATRYQEQEPKEPAT
ncbi:MAG TPA: alkylmercury lyase family protein [bacterium]|nr:alkylmercury lyase family protein [bacterium]